MAAGWNALGCGKTSLLVVVKVLESLKVAEGFRAESVNQLTAKVGKRGAVGTLLTVVTWVPRYSKLLCRPCCPEPHVSCNGSSV